ncbi:MAG: DNA mismatch repair protein MutS, partial [Thermoanaerobaculia bacterium]
DGVVLDLRWLTIAAITAIGGLWVHLASRPLPVPQAPANPAADEAASLLSRLEALTTDLEGGLDLSTGDFSVTQLANGGSAAEWLARRLPREIVSYPSDREDVAGWIAANRLAGVPETPVHSVLESESPRGRTAGDLLERHFKTATLEPFGLSLGGPDVDAAAALLGYAMSTQRSACAHVASLRSENGSDGLIVDAVTASHLELFRASREGVKGGTLLEVLDRTGTSFGARALRRLVERPLGRRAEIEERLDAVEELLSEPALLEALALALKGIPDLPRLASRIAIGASGPRDLAALALGVERAAALGMLVSPLRSRLLAEGGQASPAGFPHAVGASIRARLVDEPPQSSREGGMFRDGVDAAVDEIRTLRRASASILATLEAEERTLRGIPTLRVKFNQVFGHVFEVPASARGKIPEDAVRRQTLAAVERYATATLATADEQLRTADARLFERESQLFQELVAEATAASPALLAASARVGLLDALVSLARVARTSSWCRPQLSEEPILQVEDGRHPVVEALRAREPFIPNDTALGPDARVVVLTGPNMGGKSTYLRQNALIVLLAHLGSYVPAAAATVGLCDRIFTRVGASDSLARGESTFLVEMAETAHILRHATVKSLVILDEVGRGTSTFDGLSLAWSIAERLHDGDPARGGDHANGGAARGPARVLFATHYHELTELSLVRPAVKNRTMSVKEWNGEVVFLRKVVEGVADRSYGVQVARLAGLPESVLVRAREILFNLEKQQLDVGGRPRLAEHPGEPAPSVVQLDLFRGQGELVLDTIGKLEIDRMTPLSALNVLSTLQARLRGEG